MCSLPPHQVSSFPWSWLVFLASPLFWQCLFGSSEGRRGELVWIQNSHSECVAYVPVVIGLSGETALQKEELLLYNPRYPKSAALQTPVSSSLHEILVI